MLALGGVAPTHGTAGVPLAFTFLTGVAWAGIRPGLAPILATAAASLVMAWRERRSSRRIGRSSQGQSVSSDASRVATGTRRAMTARWTVSPSTGRPALTWE